MPKHKIEAISVPIEEIQNLTPKQLKLEQVFLDPNNPRFVVERRFEDEHIPDVAVQENLRKKIEKLGAKDLVRNIKRYGFAPTDPIVVRKFADEKYVVIEGNRRVAALKKLLKGHQTREDQLDEVRLNSIKEISTLVYHGHNPDIAWIIQGLRHMSGIKGWGLPQQATFVAKIEKELVQRSKENKQPAPEIPDVAKASGLATDETGVLLKSYSGFTQAIKDEELEDLVDERKFSLFSEAIFTKEALQKWLGWKEDERRFENTTNLKKLLTWVTPVDEKGEPTEDGEQKIKALTDVRDVLPIILADPDKLTKFEDGNLTINQVKVELEEKKQLAKIDLDEVKEQLSEAKARIEKLPLPRVQLDKRVDEFRELLRGLKDVVEQQIKNLGS